jgi:hypothetical protein
LSRPASFVVIIFGSLYPISRWYEPALGREPA